MSAIKIISALGRKIAAKKAKTPEGITQIQPQIYAESEAGAIAQRLVNAGLPMERFDDFIRSETDLIRILNQIEALEKKNLAESIRSGIRNTETGKVFDMKGKEIKDTKNIMGGEEVKETEGAIKSRLEKGNKEAAQRIRMKKMVKDAIDNVSPGFVRGDRKYNAQLVAEDLAEKKFGKEFYDLDQRQQMDLYDEALEGLSEQTRGMPDPDDFAQGGRAGFKIGGIDKARRAFLKAAAGVTGGIAALKTGLLNIGKGTTKQVAKEIITTPNAPGKPEWFDALVTRVINEGEDVTKQFAYKDRMQVNTKQISPTEEVTVYRDLDDGSVRINYGKKLKIDDSKPYEKGNIGRAINDPDQIDLIVREGEEYGPFKTVDVSTGKKYTIQKGGKTKASFEASEAEPRAVGGPEDTDIEFDGIREVDNVDDLMQDVSSLEEFATGKKLTGEKAAKAKKKREDFQKFTEDNQAQAEYLENKYGPAEQYYDEEFASGGIARMLGE